MVATEPTPTEAARPVERFTDFVQARRSGLDNHVLKNDKLWFRSVAEACGVSVPRQLGVYDSALEIPLDELPDEVVVKPTRLAGSRGVYVLRREAPGRYLDRLSGRVLEADRLKAELDRTIRRAGRPENRIMVEEVVVDERGYTPPLDYKFFVFDGSVTFIEHIRRADGNGIRFYGPQFDSFDLRERIVPNHSNVVIDPPLVPRCAREMNEQVLAIVRALDVPFVRVDMYAARGGPLLGEITRAPGGAYFGGGYRLTEAFDRELGALWRARLVKEGKPLPTIRKVPPIQKSERATVVMPLLEARDMKSEIARLRLQNQALDEQVARLRARLASIQGSRHYRVLRRIRAILAMLRALGGRRGPTDRAG